MDVIVDTNVPVAANKESEHISPECVLICVQHIRQITQDGKIVLDDQWRILREYMGNLRSSGQPGVGDFFLRWVLINYANPTRCEQVKITPTNPDEADFVEFPDDADLETFDPADRKFIAVACAHPHHPPILQAADHKWWKFKDAFANHGVTIEFLCQTDLQHWLTENERGSSDDS